MVVLKHISSFTNVYLYYVFLVENSLKAALVGITEEEANLFMMAELVVFRGSLLTEIGARNGMYGESLVQHSGIPLSEDSHLFAPLEVVNVEEETVNPEVEKEGEPSGWD